MHGTPVYLKESTLYIYLQITHTILILSEEECVYISSSDTAQSQPVTQVSRRINSQHQKE